MGEKGHRVCTSAKAVRRSYRAARYPSQRGKVKCSSIIGASGSGKSTMLRCINLLETPTSGQVLYHGRDITARGDESLAVPRKGRHGVPELQSLQQHDGAAKTASPVRCRCSARPRRGGENRHGISRARRHDAVHPARPARSGGQKRRVAIARALAMEPEVLLLRPSRRARSIRRWSVRCSMLCALAGDGLTMIVVTHEMAFARDVFTRTSSLWPTASSAKRDARRIFLKTPQDPKTANFSRFLVGCPKRPLAATAPVRISAGRLTRAGRHPV